MTKYVFFGHFLWFSYFRVCFSNKKMRKKRKFFSHFEIQIIIYYWKFHFFKNSDFLMVKKIPLMTFLEISKHVKTWFLCSIMLGKKNLPPPHTGGGKNWKKIFFHQGNITFSRFAHHTFVTFIIFFRIKNFVLRSTDWKKVSKKPEVTRKKIR